MRFNECPVVTHTALLERKEWEDEKKIGNLRHEECKKCKNQVKGNASW